MKCFLVFGIGVSSAKLARWEISVFSCWQSIYLPSNVECVRGVNTERRGKMEDGKWIEIAIPVPSCSLWQMILSEGLHNSSWAITLSWKIQSHKKTDEVLVPLSINMQLMLKRQQRNYFFHFHTWAIMHCYCFLFCLDNPDIGSIERVRVKSRSLCSAMFWCHFLEVNTFLKLSLRKVATSLKEKTPAHNAVLIGA